MNIALDISIEQGHLAVGVLVDQIALKIIQMNGFFASRTEKKTYVVIVCFSWFSF